MRQLLIILFTLFFTSLVAQQKMGTITGKIIESSSKEPIEYANVILFNSSDSTQITGTVTNKDGFFNLENIPAGSYYLDILFIGFERKQLSDLQINNRDFHINLGEIQISPTAINLSDVVVEGERPTLSYQIDKKVIDVDQLPASTSGSAAEVLENIPSITVDVEGNVSLRGSGNFTVLIDGRPTVMDPQDALQQIPATTIDNIEIITNPSAKYNPEGTAGIINIILKKNKLEGISGLANFKAGIRNNYGGDFLVEYKTDIVNTVFGLDYNKRLFPGESNEENRYLINDINNYVSSTGDTRWGRDAFGLRASFDFNLGGNNLLSLGGRYGLRDMERNLSTFRTEWSDIITPITSRNISNRTREGEFYEISLNYLLKFQEKGHELSAEFSFEDQESDEITFTELYNAENIVEGKRTTESGPSKEFNSRLNYVLPFSETNRFEAGYQGEIEISDEINGLANYNINSRNFEADPRFSNDVRYDENEHAFYTIYTGEISNFGYQLGMRAEYTKRDIILKRTNENFLVDEWDYFPTIHSSFKFSGGQQIMLSYTRRLNRPRGWALEPFYTWVDANNIRVGNPALKNEYIDAYELGFQTFISTVSLSAEVYYHRTKNKIEDIRSVYQDEENVALQTFANIGKDYSLGSEFLINFDVAKIWNVNLMGNVYDYNIEGTLYDEPFSRSSFNWRSRINNIIKFGNTQVQISGSYHSPSVSSQGRREGFFSSDLAIKQDLLDKKLSLTLQIRDLINTAKFEFTRQGPDFYTYNQFIRATPMVMLNIRYSINNFKQNRDRGDGNGENGFPNEEDM